MRRPLTRPAPARVTALPTVLGLLLGLLLGLVLASGCSTDGSDAAGAGAPSPLQTSETPGTSETPEASEAPGTSEAPGAGEAEASPEPAPTLRPEPPPEPVSLPAYFTEERAYTGRSLQLGAVREQTSDYTSYDATYRSDGLRISGVLNVPSGRGPFPAVVLAHGYIDPDIYVRGQGMTRERAYLAARGFVTLHVDYRGHAESDGTELQSEREIRLGYVADVLNAASALRRSDDVPVDDERIALFGRSMGGGVTLRAFAAAPGAFDAGVAWASVSSREDDNFNRFTDDDPERVAYVEQEYGLPGTPRGREFWREVSARPYFDRVADPLLLIHGRFDDTCPPRWARATQQALRQAGADSTLEWYDDGHAFGPAFTAAMDRMIGFLRNRMG